MAPEKKAKTAVDIAHPRVRVAKVKHSQGYSQLDVIWYVSMDLKQLCNYPEQPIQEREKI